jgi:hypothetical protein
MKITLSVIKADIGSIGGHIAPSRALLDAVHASVDGQGRDALIDFRVSFTGDDIAILMTHARGVGDAGVHRLAWDAFTAGTAVARPGQARRECPTSARANDAPALGGCRAVRGGARGGLPSQAVARSSSERLAA